MAFKSYSIQFTANFQDDNMETINPYYGWDSKNNSVILKLGCGVCDNTVDVTLSKGKTVRYPVPGLPRGRYGEANAKTEKCACGRDAGIIVVDSLPGQDLASGGSTTFMRLRVAQMIPLGITSLCFPWIAELRGQAGTSDQFWMDQHGRALVVQGRASLGAVRVITSILED